MNKMTVEKTIKRGAKVADRRLKQVKDVTDETVDDLRDTVADRASRLADRSEGLRSDVDAAAQRLSREVGRGVDGARDFARRNPGVAMTGAVLAGLVLAQLVLRPVIRSRRG